ncbi:MAG: ABC-2 family transporter protein [Alphaproteobacteria bacterium]|nr:ABC-2 family transporter protein [Alphaproteobacteria bacterium]
MGGSFRYAMALMGMVLKSAASQRGAVLLRGASSLLIHLCYIPVWFVMFSRIPSINGWGIEHALLAYAVATSCWGLVSLLAYGLRTIPEQIDNGEMDGYLTLPQPVLISAAICTSKSTGLGEVIFGIAVCVYAGIHYGTNLSYLPLLILLGSAILAGGVLFIASLGFWMRQYYSSAEEIYFNLNLMSSRPAPIFTGVFQLISLTILPFGLMTHAPIQMVAAHQTSLLSLVIIGVVGYCIFSISFFYLGLKRYESGNRFGVRG